MPVRSMKSISAVRSSPVTVSVDCPGIAPGVTSCFVITPSISTVCDPFVVTEMITRRRGSK